jgi:hypothetical protein
MFLFAGYFPKRLTPKDDWLKAPQVKEIWSVSTCISKGPTNWIDRWQHNELWLFDTVALAESVIPAAERSEFRILGYRLWDRIFDQGRDVELAAEVKPLPEPDDGFTSVGFDAVEWAHHQFGCSPLSCNGGAKTITTNGACLFQTLENALGGAKAFSTGNWEPGPYAVVEVLRSSR